MIGDFPNSFSTVCNLHKKQGSVPLLHPLDAVEVIRKLEEAIQTKLKPTTDDLYESLQWQELFGHPLLKDQQQVLLVSEA